MSGGLLGRQRARRFARRARHSWGSPGLFSLKLTHFFLRLRGSCGDGSLSCSGVGRVSQKHPRYRTKEVIVNDIAFVLNAPLSYGSRWAVLRDAAWVWTEFHGKYKGCPYWTKMA